MSDEDWATIPPVAKKCAIALGAKYHDIIFAMAEDDADLLTLPGVYPKHLRRLRKWCYTYALSFLWPSQSTKKWWFDHMAQELTGMRPFA